MFSRAVFPASVYTLPLKIEDVDICFALLYYCCVCGLSESDLTQIPRVRCTTVRYLFLRLTRSFNTLLSFVCFAYFRLSGKMECVVGMDGLVFFFFFLSCALPVVLFVTLCEGDSDACSA